VLAEVLQFNEKPFPRSAGQEFEQLPEEAGLVSWPDDEIKIISSLVGDESQVLERQPAEASGDKQRGNPDEPAVLLHEDQAQSVRCAKVLPPREVPMPGLIGAVIGIAVEQFLPGRLQGAEFFFLREHSDGHRV